MRCQHQGGGGQTYYSAKFSWKLRENEENGNGERVSESKVLLCRSATGNGQATQKRNPEYDFNNVLNGTLSKI